MSVVLNINTDDNYNQVQKFIIDNKVMLIHTYWNVRSGWFIGLYDEDNNPYIEGVQLMPNTDLLARHRYLNIFTGLLSCIDTAPVKKELDQGITFDNFGEGKRWQLVYFTLQELSALS